VSYKGNDLDLRTSYAFADEVAEQPSVTVLPELAQGGPIRVDHTVLACCNTAYDAALFHGTRVVRLEHLLYSLTRVEAAREILEQHGVRSQQLRRDTAAAIAASAPASDAGNRGPHASAELETLLRRAAGRAGQDSVPASIQDLLRAMLDHRGELPSTALLLRSASDLPQLERWAAAGRTHILQPGSTMAPMVARELVARLETLETTMRTLVAEAASERKAMLHMLGELQYELRAARQENVQPVIVIERIEGLGKSIMGLVERFDAMRTLAPASTAEARLAALEIRLADQPGAIANAIAYMLDERRAAEPEPLQLTATDSHGTEVGQKLEALETMLRAQWERMGEGRQVHERLNELFATVTKLVSDQQTLADNLDSWRLDHAGDFGIVSNRLKDLEQLLQQIISSRSS
jgi:hypothetical protein